MLISTPVMLFHSINQILIIPSLFANAIIAAAPNEDIVQNHLT